jgi:hypothetical protein
MSVKYRILFDALVGVEVVADTTDEAIAWARKNFTISDVELGAEGVIWEEHRAVTSGFTVMDYGPIPWDLVREHRGQAHKNHNQSLEELDGRGGLDPAEAVAVIRDRAWIRMPQDEAVMILDRLVLEFLLEVA